MDRFAPFGHKSGVWGVVSNCYLLTKFAHIINSGTKVCFYNLNTFKIFLS